MANKVSTDQWYTKPQNSLVKKKKKIVALNLT